MPSVKLVGIPTIKRLPSYLHVIETARDEGQEFISGTTIAEELELEAIQVRKDLSITGIQGKPRRGFPVDLLIEAICGFLQWDTRHRVALIGAGNLGTALMGHREFAKRGMDIIAAFDVDPAKIGAAPNGVKVYAIADLPQRIPELGIEMAIITVPSAYAQAVTDIAVRAGIKGLWNFTNVKLRVPKDVVVQKEDLSSGYAVLAVKMARARAGTR